MSENTEAEVLETFFGNVYEFVEQWVIPRYRRKSPRWDPNWFENIEALDRLEALWRAWEYLRLEGMTGMAVFWRDYFDPTMRELTEGTFFYMDEYADTVTKPRALQSNPPPQEVFRS